MATIKLNVMSYPQEGYLRHTYSPLKVLITGDGENKNKIEDFNISSDKLNITSKTLLNIDCQPSYDGTVNLILNDDVNPPRIINTRFTKQENDTFKVITRNQLIQTNLYNENSLDTQTRLIKNSNFFPKIDLIRVDDGGCLKGGNYTIYVKYIDGDFNESPVMCESGQISIFHGSDSSANGALSDEITSKQFTCKFSNLDISYNAFKLYLIREYSDLNGIRLREGLVLDEKYTFSESSIELTINGYEQMSTINPDDINVNYLSINHAKTQAQVQNMLFFGNVGQAVAKESELQNCSYFIEVLLRQSENIGWINPADYSSKGGSEYYDTENIYYRVGYWPDEYYRLGIVYIMNDDTTTPAFPLRGCAFSAFSDDYNNIEDARANGASNLINSTATLKCIFNPGDGESERTVLEKNTFITKDKYLINTFGVFKTPKEYNGIEDAEGDVAKRKHVIIDAENKTIKPFFFQMRIPNEVKTELIKLGVKGYFFVRQKRIPTTLGQGIALAIDDCSYAPMINYGGQYITEGFLVQKGNWDNDDITNENVNKGNDGDAIIPKYVLKQNWQFQKSLISAEGSRKQSSCLISLDADLSPSMQSSLSGESFVLEDAGKGSISLRDRCFTVTNIIDKKLETPAISYALPCIYVNSETPYKFIKDYGFSTKFGSQETTKDVAYFGKKIHHTEVDEELKGAYHIGNQNLLRGVFTGIIGICGSVEDNTRYNIRIPGYLDTKTMDYFTIRKNDNSTFHSVSDRYLLSESTNDHLIDVYRGDCYTNTVTIRLLRNFVDSDTPINDSIVDINTWNKHYAGYMAMGGSDPEDPKVPSGDWSMMNKSDLNAVPLGMWLTYKCLSSHNLGIRSIDRSYSDEEALMGNPRGFHPLYGMSTSSSNNIAESNILNGGYSTTVGFQSHLCAQDLPYIKELFDNRIIFSNVQVEDDFRNGYRVFQGLSYKDIDRQYGAIVKLLPWGTDLLCVFEHGIGIVPVNQKALMSTTTGQSIHMYGAGVLQSQVSLITGDYGSVWQESIIRTPIGVYGVDTFAKKIWRYSASKGFETISDMTIQRFLNDHIILKERTSTPDLGLRNVKTHYNNYKGDVMFTFYNYDRNEEWNLCYNERLGKWITRYSWTPIYSENINNIYYSFDKNRTTVLSQIGNLLGDDYGLKCTDSDLYYVIPSEQEQWANVEKTFVLTNTTLKDTRFTMSLDSIETSYLDSDGKEIYLKNENPSDDVISILEPNDTWTSAKVTLNPYALSTWFEESLPKITLTSVEEEIDENGKVISSEEIITETFDPKYKTTSCPLWIRANVSVNCFYGNPNKKIESGIDRHYVICFMAKNGEGALENTENTVSAESKMYDKMFINGVYVHGRAGIFDEIDYTDDELDNQILPTKWYDKQEPFEFEFSVSDPLGMHKIFENLMIISNRAEPESIQFEIEGDSYSVFKAMDNDYKNPTFNKDLKKSQYKNNTLFKNASVKWDTVLNQYSILMDQECKSIEKFGRRIGNMHYKEDAWYITINPLLLNKSGKIVSTKLRDKYLKVRVRYSGKDLALISAIKTTCNISAS